MIEKYIEFSCEAVDVFDSPLKTANYQPEVYVPEEMQEAIRGLQPDPRFAYAHMIAMTDGDYYGNNLNGDVFTEDELTGMQSYDEAMKNPGDNRGVPMPRYKTFEDAKFFRHHDNKPTSPYYGDVIKAVWNDIMKRVELLVRIAREQVTDVDPNMQPAPDIVMKFDRRGYLTVSMGTRITRESCTYCGASNKFVKDRCQHLASQMGRIMPNGVKVAAINYGMRFFDISDVTVPADPVAFTLQKVASTTHASNPAIDVTEKKARWEKKLSDMVKFTPVEATIGDATYKKDCDCDHEVKEMTSDEMKRAFAAAHNDLETVLGTVTASGMVLTPPELAYFTYLDEGEKVAGFEFRGFDRIPLDKFSPVVYDALADKIAARSGFVAPVAAPKWEPVKIAEQGGEVMARYYGYYRASVGALPRQTFIKAAHQIPAVRELHQGDMSKVEAAIYSLAHSGLDEPI